MIKQRVLMEVIHWTTGSLDSNGNKNGTLLTENAAN